ncbi:hypothetical protein EAO76_42455 [Streptomyces sp. sk2.1]|nr:hypothetical protein EAO76_42455 [Streptomyces sp. sk2.1]
MAALDRYLADHWQGGGDRALLHFSQIYPCGKDRQGDRSPAESRSRGRRRHRDAARHETGRRTVTGQQLRQTVTVQARWAQVHEWWAAVQALSEPNKQGVTAHVLLSVVGPTVECAVFLW